MLGEISSEQLSEWQVFATHFHALPDGPREAGLIVSSMSRIWSGTRSEPEDFTPIRPLPRPEQSADEGIAALLARGAKRR